MCLGGGGSKVSTPKPPPLPPPIPAPPPPKPAPPPPKKLQEPGEAPDIRIGAAKKETARRSKASTSSADSKAAKSLTIGNNQGMTL